MIVKKFNEAYNDAIENDYGLRLVKEAKYLFFVDQYDQAKYITDLYGDTHKFPNDWLYLEKDKSLQLFSVNDDGILTNKEYGIIGNEKFMKIFSMEYYNRSIVGKIMTNLEMQIPDMENYITSDNGSYYLNVRELHKHLLGTRRLNLSPLKEEEAFRKKLLEILNKVKVKNLKMVGNNIKFTIN